MIFSFRCLSKDHPKCFCSFTVGTTVPLKKRNGWFGLFFLQENNSSVICNRFNISLKIIDVNEKQ